MRVLFSVNTLNYRGTTGAVLDYAKYNQELLGNESVITYDETIPYEIDMGTEAYVLEDIKKKFNIIPNQGSILPVLENQNFDLVYRIGSGQALNEKLPIKDVYHAVFQFKNDQISAYVSKWLSEKMTNGNKPYVNHIVEMPNPCRNYREYFNIPKDAIVLGRHGGMKTFDINFVKEYIKDTINKKKNLYYLFINTEPFFKHDRIIYVGPVSDKQRISNYIDTCDAMLHARERGESFGLSIAEFLYFDKPVISWQGGVDKNHVEMLKGTGLLYSDRKELSNIIDNIKQFNKQDFKLRVKNYTPTRVMENFKKVFIDA